MTMNWVEFAQRLVMAVYTVALAVVCVYGFHRYVLVYLYYRHRRKVPRPAGRFEEPPRVTVQLPMYNEKYVAERIIARTCEIHWPREKLQIQVLDDSVDETVRIASAAVERARRRGFDIEYIHRDDRTGYKAGALQNGLATATGEFITIFDADFLPDPDVLANSIDYFTDPAVCAVQARWEHINRNDSLLTRTQAFFLDGHFAIEHVARNRSGRFMQFNGTAGTWRKAAILDAGAWQHDTLTEDMDLSYRAQLRGWKFVFLPDLTAPAELPPEMNSFKAQQFRWTKGGVQTAMKMLPRICLSKIPLKTKIEAFFHLTCFCVHGCVLLLVTLLFPVMFIRLAPVVQNEGWRTVLDLTVFALATMSASVFYLASQYELFKDWRTILKYLPFLMALGVGVSLSNAKALAEALLGRRSEFVRTPKYGAGTSEYKARRQAGHGERKRRILPYVEFVLGIYMTFCGTYSLLDVRMAMAAPFLMIFAVGFFYVSILSFQRRPSAALEPAAETAGDAESSPADGP